MNDKKCPNCHREIYVNYEMHVSRCWRFTTYCEACDIPVLNSELERHKEEHHKSVPCLQCGMVVPQDQAQKHKEECPESIVCCTFCQLENRRKDHSQHVAVCMQRNLLEHVNLQTTSAATPSGVMSDEELAQMLQDKEFSPLVDTIGHYDLELARTLQQEEAQKVQEESTCRDTMFQSDLTLARKLQEEESSVPLPPPMDHEIARKLQDEEHSRRDIMFLSDLNLARKLQVEESSVPLLTSMDERIAQKIQDKEKEENEKQRKHFVNDQILARCLQQEDSLSSSALLQAGEQKGKDRPGPSMQQSSTSLAEDRGAAVYTLESQLDRAVALQLQQNEYLYSQPIGVEANCEPKDSSRPPEWETQTRTTELFPVRKESSEWTNVERKFKATMTSSEILSISRVQNSWLWEKYHDHKKRLDRKNDGVVNEMQLFHGTRENAPKNIYEGENGFDMRYSRQGLWGQANYFAVNASYSNAYAFKTPDGCKEMFLVKVLTGESYSCPSDRTLRKPPEKPPDRYNRELQLVRMDYDTINGETYGHRVYMTYDNDKAYPAYLIKYR